MSFEPTREAGLRRLRAFLPKAGAYARARNYDRPPHDDVSRLSPYLRHRLITEDEVLSPVLQRHGPRAEKFVQEIFWRTYWKGWLEMRPAVWQNYQQSLRRDLDRIERFRDLRSRYEAAVTATTGIACFDAWSRELVDTGYVHNHARMWFASIWIYTLELPWSLGADFFYRHLLDGDPASNTLSWRWVCGQQTLGKTYLARRDNIRKYTEGRFDPDGLATVAPALDDSLPPAAKPDNIPTAALVDAAGHGAPLPECFATLRTAEDLDAGHLPRGESARFSLVGEPARSVLETSEPVRRFVTAATEARQDEVGLAVDGDLSELVEQLAAHGAVVTPYACTGPTEAWLARLGNALDARGVPLLRAVRGYDRVAWPHARRGFFALKKKIPRVLEHLGHQRRAVHP
ncbi:MAG: FAD-binding domain-containing protein [Myxococcota bacterium]